MNLTPPPPSQNSHAVRWHCTAESERRVAEIQKLISLSSPDWSASLRPSFERKTRPEALIGPNDSTATGWEIWWAWMFEYFAVLRVAASSDADPASRALLLLLLLVPRARRPDEQPSVPCRRTADSWWCRDRRRLWTPSTHTHTVGDAETAEDCERLQHTHTHTHTQHTDYTRRRHITGLPIHCSLLYRVYCRLMTKRLGFVVRRFWLSSSSQRVWNLVAALL